MAKSEQLFERRKQRNRYRLACVSGGKPRLSVFRSNQHIYAQVIDDRQGRTLAAASTLEKGVREQRQGLKAAELAEQVGKRVAERARAAGVERVVFDRGGYRFHGCVKALAAGARDGGLVF